MRLTCPNCGAQYEVPAEVIPPDGRDVQCSNCGDTWFQAHPDHPVPDAVAQPDPGAADPAPVPDPDLDPDIGPDAPPEPDPSVPPAAEEDAGGRRVARGLDPDVRDILQEEARHEAGLRAAESSGLESQPDLGLDNLPDDRQRREQEARDRMARMRGEQVQPVSKPPEPEPKPCLLYTSPSPRD